ncbi:efflux RND transporter periplasmic adaptor subunit [Niveispirillum irakense]|uniref:efflux RND transporter periplasmic adaptor subunit n=1 Tax=Niveispirillum irakense TaxID=34011 RepID=UPI00040DD083|nr:efflux RND transporter periplasmic adaptor subunit [Niveispirillum irakense]
MTLMQAASQATASTKPPSLKRSRRKGGRRVLYAGIALLAAAGAGIAWWLSSAGSTGEGQYLTTAVERGDIEDSVAALGNLQPLDYVDVGTQVSGQLRKIHFLVGQEVEQGTLLAEIDPTVYQSRVDSDKAQLENLNAQLAQREAELVLAKQQFERQRNLLKDNATSQDSFQSAEANLRAAEASIRSVNAQIRQTTSTLRGDEANLGYTKIYAPMTGTVVSQNAKQGQTLNANQSAPIVLRIADLAKMTVTTQVSEADVSRLKIGMPAYFTTLGRPDRRWQGTLRQVEPTPTVENNVVLYNALFDVGNEGGQLMTQMTAQVFFVVAQAKDTLRIPLAALRAPGRPEGAPPRGGDGAPRRPGAGSEAGPRAEGAPRQRPAPAADGEAGPGGRPRMVTVLKADGTTEERRIMVGVADRVNIQVLSGLEEGERVVIGRALPAGQARSMQQQQQGPRMRPPGVL